MKGEAREAGSECYALHRNVHLRGRDNHLSINFIGGHRDIFHKRSAFLRFAVVSVSRCAAPRYVTTFAAVRPDSRYGRSFDILVIVVSTRDEARFCSRPMKYIRGLGKFYR